MPLNDAAFLRSAMLALGATQRQIASLLGWTQGAVSQVMNDRRGLNPLARRALEQEVATYQAIHMPERGLPACQWRLRRTPTVDTYLRHLPTCPRCLVRAVRAGP